ncbi:RraA family protein [Roseitranquillus sediminis]|uniref:RraA family protein n=1 Tax=Roseitranquillus sediminis TaxID=2809051 RepID=UPI001D0C9526|nr:RraA family protein [Roseitranquillus sediminis]MBM9594699.1 RraA family protein [Roseitranquillus sediminis]
MIGMRILGVPTRPSPEMVAQFADLPVANISDVMARLEAGGPRIRPMHSGGVLCGPAFTVKTRPGDNLLIHHALDVASPGDVIVVDGGGDLTNSLMGEMMLAYAEKRGLGGVVLNGAIRDHGYVRSHAFPVFAAGVTHRGPYKHGPGEINVPIALDGMSVAPGDIIVGDDDGVVCVPLGEAPAVYAAAKKKHEAETAQMEAILAGSNDRSWVQKAMEKLLSGAG